MRITICPKCKSTNVEKEITASSIIGIPQNWVCNNCKFSNNVFPEIELVFYNMRMEKRSIKSFLVDEVKKMFPKKTIILVQEKGNGSSTISARREDGKIKVNNLLELAVRDLNHSAAGGHDPAAGGIILTEDLEQFKKNVIRILKDKYGDGKTN